MALTVLQKTVIRHRLRQTPQNGGESYIHAEALLLHLDEAEASLLLLWAKLRGLLQILFTWFHKGTSFQESDQKRSTPHTQVEP
jgi:hypothetical protein